MLSCSADAKPPDESIATSGIGGASYYGKGQFVTELSQGVDVASNVLMSGRSNYAGLQN